MKINSERKVTIRLTGRRDDYSSLYSLAELKQAVDFLVTAKFEIVKISEYSSTPEINFECNEANEKEEKVLTDAKLDKANEFISLLHDTEAILFKRLENGEDKELANLKEKINAALTVGDIEL